ncbi:NUDIX domain-containing protein [Mycoplasmopsis verecunda]|uniref:NUDIX domain-containing protein n=1 Tax=Mycoplasmopsis verecunda TaxID=171291 RepID=A0A1T4KJ83_9BACT|nr:NUDIX domain-containing protein [Mycoplasmopsis verecunda]WPB54243.1 NUDIX domain-containing protein [Mycoplasmopsis verecunda]SJZ42460.1 NUDIX domain-containing protein [Mycoplasmopsis verecunda]
MLEKSCGAIIFRKFRFQTKVLLVKQLNNIWIFPKGHIEGNETPVETAHREVMEETKIKNFHIIPDIKYVDNYVITSTGNDKEVTYFLAYTHDNEVPKHVSGESKKAKYFSIKRAYKIIKNQAPREFLLDAYEKYQNLNISTHK